jgi:hypothetical protein
MDKGRSEICEGAYFCLSLITVVDKKLLWWDMLSIVGGLWHFTDLSG